MNISHAFRAAKVMTRRRIRQNADMVGISGLVIGMGGVLLWDALPVAGRVVTSIGAVLFTAGATTLIRRRQMRYVAGLKAALG